ncbi:hypothetical protein [Aureispira anguillae]|uniref:Outer membrane protein beta-barrel domain-containing protein n=1 Tax=Aureispira anguillae TaxID=2864201 RepID=A0A916DTB7_9BACT|nr:hypothetical protein [Aureispira anguillae]BDS11652.1 hypothetical protein AsAng_0023660 [Aureispira anguillae]
MNQNKLSNWLISLIVICLMTTVSWAQEAQDDVVYLENGSVIRGQVMEYDPKGNIKIKIYGGSVLVYESSKVIKIEKEASQNTTPRHSKTAKKDRTNHRPGIGLYHTVAGGTLMGISDWGSPEPGISLNTTTGWHFHRLIGLGGGVGVMRLGGYSFVPVYANIRGNFMKSSASLFYQIDVGYGIAVKDQMFGFGGIGNLQTAKGGLYLRPSIGVRFPSYKRTHVFLNFGYVIQFGEYEYIDWNNNPIFEKRTFYRPSLRVGITF